jgi:hypothetical protein
MSSGASAWASPSATTSSSTGRNGRRNFGAGDLLEVEQADGRKSLIPFKSGVADLQDGQIVLDPEFLA